MKDENCEKIKNVLRVIFYPLVLIRRKIFVYLCEYYRKRDLKKLASLLYYEEFYKLKYCSTVVYMVPRA